MKTPAIQVPKRATLKTGAANTLAKAKPETLVKPDVKVQSVAKISKTAATTNSKVNKPVAKAIVPAATKVTAKAKRGKGNKETKAKLVRDSFTFPATDYARIGELKQRALKSGLEIKKSELLRAGLAALSVLTDAELLKALGCLDRLKPGRPVRK
jgi:hypothetical protein